MGNAFIRPSITDKFTTYHRLYNENKMPVQPVTINKLIIEDKYGSNTSSLKSNLPYY